MISEWKDTGEKMIPGVLTYDPSDFKALITKLDNESKGIGLREGHVPASTYWLVQDDNKVLGAVNIRHYLNEILQHHGGHIGQGIRPTERGKGYGTKMLGMALEIALKMGITAVLVTCDKKNIASARTIVKNGGILEAEDVEEGVPFQQYWIHPSPA